MESDHEIEVQICSDIRNLVYDYQKRRFQGLEGAGPLIVENTTEPYHSYTSDTAYIKLLFQGLDAGLHVLLCIS